MSDQHPAQISAPGEKSPGFVWRLQTEEGDATQIHTPEDEQFIINVSVSEISDDLFRYRTEHVGFLRNRRDWFRRMDEPHRFLRWIEAGRILSSDEGLDRLDPFRREGATEEAFTSSEQFESPAVSL